MDEGMIGAITELSKEVKEMREILLTMRENLVYFSPKALGVFLREMKRHGYSEGLRDE